jgi:hypothetical protein
LSASAVRSRSNVKTEFVKVVGAFVALMMAALSQPARAGFVGVEYEGGVEVPGWESQGAGLLEEPVWYHFYKRQDNSYFVLMNWKLPRAHFRVTDELLIPPIGRDHVLTFDCKPPQTNVFIKIFAVVRPNFRKEQWRDVRQAWEVKLHDGTISPFPTKGVACLNEGYGAQH